MTQNTSSQRGIRAGRMLGGRYLLVSRIAKGGMGEVWRVRDQRTSMLVAAKVLRPELSGEEISLSRLRLEAANTLRARHPNIAAVLDSGEDDGQGWIVMELVEGRPLTEFVGDGKRLNSAELIPILTQVAYALDASSQAGVVHRDIKPANIMVRPDGMVKLTDFGISFAEGQANLTAVGMVMGTAQYLAPEQALGAEATTSGDLYSLGVIAYEALAGHRPFTGKSPVEIAMSHVKDEIPSLPDDVPEPMQQVVYGMLAKEPAERPPSGTALVRTLNRVARELGLSTSPIPLVAVKEPVKEPVKQLAKDPVEQPGALSTETRADGEVRVEPNPPGGPSKQPSKPESTPPPASPVRRWRPVSEGRTGPVIAHSSAESSNSALGSANHGSLPSDKPSSHRSKTQVGSQAGMWLVGFLVLLTVVLIFIAMIRDRGSVEAAFEPSSTPVVSSTEVQTWLIPTPVC